MAHNPDFALARGELRRAVFDARASTPAPPIFSVQRMLRALVSGEPLTGFEAEIVNHANQQRAGGMNPFMSAHAVPFEVLSGFARDLTVASASGGGYLAGAATADAVGPFDGSVARRLGVRIEPAKNDFTVPVVGTAPAVTWLTHEGASASEATPTVGTAGATPKTASVVVEVSDLHLKQASSEPFLRRLLLTAANAAIDTALFAGTGASGQPTGLMNLPAITSYSGGSFDLADAAAVEKLVGDQLVDDSPARWCAATGVRETLRQRVRVASTDSRTLWGEDDRMLGRPALASARMPTGGLLYGDFSEVAVPLFGPGIEISADPYTKFRERITALRVMVSLDVLAARPGALVRVASFS